MNQIEEEEQEIAKSSTAAVKKVKGLTNDTATNLKEKKTDFEKREIQQSRKFKS